MPESYYDKFKYLSDSRKADEMIEVYFGAKKEGLNPYEFWMKKRHPVKYSEYRIAKPTFAGWSYDGKPIEESLLKDYDKIYDSIIKNPQAIEKVEAFMDKTNLPIESVVQMLHPNYYRFMKSKNTPHLISKDKDFLNNRYYSTRWNGSEYTSEKIREVPKVEYADLIESKDRFDIDDLTNLESNVVHIGNRHPFSEHFVAYGDEGYVNSFPYDEIEEEFHNIIPDTVFGTWNHNEAEHYTFLSPLGTVHSVTLGGRPYINSNAVEGYEPTVNKYETHRISKNDIAEMKKNGFDYYADPLGESILAFRSDAPYVSLRRNNGQFNGYTGPGTSMYGEEGGKVKK